MDKIRLIDVGARGGISPRWDRFHSLLDVMGFEPDPSECERLNKQRWPYEAKFAPQALGARDGEHATLYITKARGCSSLLKPNMDLVLQFPSGPDMEITAQLPLVLSRMDTICANWRPDVLKVDTQGTELSILQGAGDLLDTVTAVELEVEFLHQYQDQPLFADVDIFMRSKGFMLRGLRRSTWRQKADYAHAFGGQLMHGDALYLRHSLLDSEKGHIILAAYRQYDLLSLYGATHLIPEDGRLVKLAQWVLGRYDGRWLRGVMDKTRRATDNDWHDHDFF
jgi:FkbM family methyltransferase